MTEQPEEKLSVRRRRNRRRYYTYEVLTCVLALCLVYTLCRGLIKYVGQKTIVEGDSMLPYLESGDHLIVDKISYTLGDPNRFDVIVFRYLHKENSYYIKRIIGLPGETVQIIDGRVYINGELLQEEYGNAQMTNPGRAVAPLILGPDEYFVLGDNRNISSDSRDPLVAGVKRDQIIGKVFVRIYPLDRLGWLRSTDQ